MGDTGNGHVFGYIRHHDDGRVLLLGNLSEATQSVAANTVRIAALGYAFTELVSGDALVLGENALVLEPYQLLCLVT